MTFAKADRLLLLVWLFLAGNVSAAAEPNLRAIDIRGLRINGTTTLTIDGDDLGKTPRLLLPFSAKQTLKPGATDKKATFDVTLGAEIEPGYYQLRTVSEAGVSLPVVIAVDRMPQLAFALTTIELPVAMHGSVASASVLETTFVGKAKQRVMIDVEAQRLGSKLRPILHLYSPKKLQIAWAWGTPSLHGDARIEATLPEDGAYRVTLHDAEYAAPTPSYFRLRLGNWSYVDQVYPPVVAKGQSRTLTLLGMAEPLDVPFKPTAKENVSPLVWPKGDAWSGLRPFVSLSSNAEFVEAAKSDKLQEIAEGLAGISGRLLTPYEEDRFRVAVKPGKKIKLEVFAERIGSPIDVALVVRNDKGDQLARGEDSPGTLDPVLEYTVPEKITSIIVGVLDAQGRGGTRGVYRLVVDPQTPRVGSGDFKLFTTMQRLSLPISGRVVFPVLADRRGGYAGRIDITSSHSAIKLAGTTIPDAADGALVTAERSDPAFDAIIANLSGRAADGSEHAVAVKGHPLEKLQPWLASEIAVAASNDKASEFAIDWRDFPESAVLNPGSKLLLPIKLTRPSSKSTVKFTLLTSQNAPLVNNQPDPNKSLRQDKIADLAATATTGDVTMIVPAELASPVYDVTVQAELLDAAKKPLAIAFAPVRRLQVVLPIALKLDGPNRIEATYDAKKGSTAKIQGKVERRAGVKADVLLAFTGLPAGAKAETVTVKADATTFAVNITLPPTIMPGEITGIKMSGSIVPDAKQPNVRVRSRDIELTLVLKSAIP